MNQNCTEYSGIFSFFKQSSYEDSTKFYYSDFKHTTKVVSGVKMQFPAQSCLYQIA